MLPRVLSVLVMLGSAVLLGPRTWPAYAATPVCETESATVVGTTGHDTLTGTSGDDVFVARGGADVIRGLGGDDVICGGSGADTIVGGPGSDTISGGAEADSLSGGDGADSLLGKSADDEILGGAGHDLLVGGEGQDTLRGGTGDNVCDWDVGESEVSSCRYDFTAPTIVSVTASPSSASPGDVITVSAQVTDDSGVQAVGLQASLNGTTATWCDKYASLTSGTAQDGEWSTTCKVPATANSGTYSIYPYASDVVDNWVNTNGGPSSDVRGSFTIT